MGQLDSSVLEHTLQSGKPRPTTMYHVYFDGKSRGPYLLDQIKSMWASGIITADATYLTEGEAEWKPLANLFAPGIPTRSTAQPEAKEENISSLTEIDPTVPAQSVAEKPWDSSTPRPWRRLWARCLDFQILGAIPASLLAAIWLHFVPNAGPITTIRILIVGPITMIGILIVLVLVLEPLCLSRFGNTPGKWLLGISLRNSNGDALSSGEAVGRSLSVLWRLSLPLASAIFMFLAYRDLKKRGKTKWDRKGRFLVTYSPIGIGRRLAIVSLVALVFVKQEFDRGRFKENLNSQIMILMEEMLRDDPAYISAKDAEEKADYPKMLEMAKQLVQSYPNSGLANKCLGDAYYYMGDQQNALVAINKAIKIKPDDVVAWHDRGCIREAMGQFSEAEIAYKRGLAIDPSHPLLLADLGAIQMKNRQTQGSGLKFTQQAEAQLMEGAFDDRHGEIRAESIWLTLSSSYVLASQPKDAQRAFEKTITLDPENAFAWSKFGYFLVNSGQPADAISKFNEAIKIDAQNSYAWFGLGRAYHELGDNANSVYALEQSVVLDPSQAYWLWELGLVYNEINRHADAVMALRKAAQLSPDDARIWKDIGGAYHCVKQDKDSVIAFERAVKLNPNDKELWVLLGNAYNAIGRPDVAREAYRHSKLP